MQKLPPKEEINLPIVRRQY